MSFPWAIAKLTKRESAIPTRATAATRRWQSTWGKKAGAWVVNCALAASMPITGFFTPSNGIPRARALTDKPILLRLDSAHNARNNRDFLREQDQVDFQIKWNTRKQDPLWLGLTRVRLRKPGHWTVAARWKRFCQKHFRTRPGYARSLKSSFSPAMPSASCIWGRKSASKAGLRLYYRV